MKDVSHSIQKIIDCATHVQIISHAARDFARSCTPIDLKRHWLSAAPFDFSILTEEQRLHFLFFLNCISFSYWGEPKWTVEYLGLQHDGAWGMILALRRAIDEGIPILDPSYVATIHFMQFASILRANTAIPLLNERFTILRNSAQTVVDRYHGSITNFFAEHGNNVCVLFPQLLIDFPHFRDETDYKGCPVAFHKRAQLFLSDVYQLFRGTGKGALKNIHTLTACADYKLPLILRRLGILDYAKNLSEKIDLHEELPHGCIEEVEIRAATIWAVEHIRQEVAKLYPDVLAMEINDHLWLLSQKKLPSDRPYHRTRTIAY